MTDVLRCSITPFGADTDQKYSPWHGSAVSVDGVSKAIPADESELAEVLYDYDSADDWDGTCAGVVKLKDGRLMAWESWWGPTGNGFAEDAYGGDSDVYFAKPENLGLLVRAALSEDMRRLAKVPTELWETE